MATIDVHRTHSLTKDEAKNRAETFARSMQEKLDLEYRWEGDRIVFQASRGAAKGSKGSVDVGASEIHVHIELPFLLRMLKSTIESKVDEKLTKLL